MKKLLDRFEETLSGIVFVVMLFLTFINVVFRNFSASISFTEEITTSLFVLLCLLGTSLAARDHAHLGLSAFTELLPVKVRKALAVIGDLLGVVFSVILLITGIQMVIGEIQMKTISIALQIPQWIYGMFLPIGAGLMAIRFFGAMIDDIHAFKENKQS